LAEDGPIAARYNLTETPSSKPLYTPPARTGIDRSLFPFSRNLALAPAVKIISLGITLYSFRFQGITGLIGGSKEMKGPEWQKSN
jgi:hypothetical protein